MAARKQKQSIRSADKSNRLSGRLFGLIFGLPFFGMGALFCWMMGLSPLLKSLGSNDWVQTECRITSSEVERHRSSDGSTYSIEISFSYQFGGQEYLSDTYNFNRVNSSGYEGKAKVVAQYAEGSTQTCWVNPEQPSQAVLSRAIPTIVYWIIPFSSVFMLIGLGASAATLGLFPKQWKLSPDNRHKPVTTEASGSRVLKPDASGIGKLIGAVVFAGLWNGIVSLFVVQAVKSHQRGAPDWFLTLFLIPFVVIGIGAVLSIFYFLLALRNPKLTLALGESSPRLGDSVQLDWEANQSLHRLKTLRISLIGRESATYRRGTRSVTDHATFHSDTILELDGPVSEQSGSLTLDVPIDSMHTFDSGNNEILWHLQVDGDIARYPDIKDSYPITVRPRDC